MRSRVKRRSCVLRMRENSEWATPVNFSSNHDVSESLRAIERVNDFCGKNGAGLFKVDIGTVEIAINVATAPHRFNVITDFHRACSSASKTASGLRPMTTR